MKCIVGGSGTVASHNAFPVFGLACVHGASPMDVHRFRCGGIARFPRCWVSHDDSLFDSHTSSWGVLEI